MGKLRGLWREELGTTVIEYGLIALGLSLVIVAAAGAVGSVVDLVYGVVPESVSGLVSASA